MKSKKFFQAPIQAYQYISRMLPGSCRYYPTCSEYAKWQFEFNPPHSALLFSSLRILRCNPLFEGGIDYPLVRFTPPKRSALCKPNPSYGTISIRYWLVPKKQQGSSVAMLSQRVNIQTPDSKKGQGSGVAMLSRRVNIHTPDSQLYYILKDLDDTHLEFPA